MSDPKKEETRRYVKKKDALDINIYDVYLYLTEKMFNPDHNQGYGGIDLYRSMYKKFVRFYFCTKKRLTDSVRDKKGKIITMGTNSYEVFDEPEDGDYLKITEALINSVDDILTPIRNLLDNRGVVPKGAKLYTLDELKETIKLNLNLYAKTSINFNFFRKTVGNERVDASLLFGQIDDSRTSTGQYHNIYLTFVKILEMFDLKPAFYVKGPKGNKEIYLTVIWVGEGNFAKSKLYEAFYYFLQEMTGANASFFAEVFFPYELQLGIDKVFRYQQTYQAIIDEHQGDNFLRITPSLLMTQPLLSPTTTIIDDPVPIHEDAACTKELSEKLEETKKEEVKKETVEKINDGFDEDDPEEFEELTELTEEQKILLSELVHETGIISDLRRRLGRALHAFLVAEGAIITTPVIQTVKGGPSLSTVERFLTSALILKQFFAPLPSEDNPLKVNSDENIPDNDIPGSGPPDDVPQGPARFPPLNEPLTQNLGQQLRDEFGGIGEAVYSDWDELREEISAGITRLLASVFFSGDNFAAEIIAAGVERIFQDYALALALGGLSVGTVAALYTTAQYLAWEIYSTGRYQTTVLMSYIRNDVTGSRVYLKSGGGSGGFDDDNNDDDDGFYFEDEETDEKDGPYNKISPKDLDKHLSDDVLVQDVIKNAVRDVSSNIGALENSDLGISQIKQFIGSNNIPNILNQKSIIDYARLLFDEGKRDMELVYQVVYNLAIIYSKALKMTYIIPKGLGLPLTGMLISILLEPVTFILYQARLIDKSVYDTVYNFRVVAQKLIFDVFHFVYYISTAVVKIAGFIAANPLFAVLGVLTVIGAFAYYQERKSIKQNK